MIVIELLLPLVLAATILYINALDIRGTITAVILIYLVMIPQNISWLIPIVASFFLITTATKIKSNLRQRHELRTTSNVLSNGGIAVAMAFFGHFYGFLGALASATADSMSSEVGKLSKEKPRYILNPSVRVKAGTNGGITLLGTTAGLIGATIIGMISLVIFNNPKTIIVAAVAGTFGNLVDSWIGAVLENKGYLDNAGTNFFATGAGSLVGILLGAFL